MRVSIHQPSYFPWVGLLDKVSKTDTFVLMDEVQMSDSAFQHRNLFVAASGAQKFLTIPVKKGHLSQRFRDIEIASQDWRVKHHDFVRNNYGKHPFAREIMPRVEDFFSLQTSSLFEQVFRSMRLSFELFAIDTKIVLQSELNYDRNLRRGELVLALARAVGASVYVSGSGGKAYLDESAFGADLRLEYNEYVEVPYPQKGLSEFRSGLAGLDVLFNLGVSGARRLLLNGRVGSL